MVFGREQYDARIDFIIDKSDIDQTEAQGKKVEQEVNKAMERARFNMIATARMVLYAVQAITGVADQVLMSMFEASLLAYEALVAIAAGTAATGVGFLKAGFQMITATAILIQAYNIAQGRQEIATRQSMGLNMLKAATVAIA